MIRCRPLVPLAALAVTALVATPGAAEEVGSPADPGVPVVLVGDGAETDGEGATVERTRAVEVDGLGAALADAPDGAVRLDLFDDTSLVVQLAPSLSGVDGWQAWSGLVDGEPDSSIVLTSDGTSTAGLVSSSDGTFEIRTTTDGTVVDEVDQSAFAESARDTVPGAIAPTPTAGTAPPPQPDPGAGVAAADVPAHPVLDVLVGYTPEALAWTGGTVGAMNSLIASSIAATNASFSTSDVAGAVRLAGTFPIGATTSVIGPDEASLVAIANGGDGVADGIIPAGDAAGADLIAVIGQVAGGVCGIGYRPGRFTVTDASCAVANLSFPHELGHNLSLDHDRYVSADVGDPNRAFPYGYGYVDVANRWRTVMAYNNRCSDAQPQVFCTRLARFSNPDQTYGGNPLGRPFDAADSADNRRVLNQTLWSNEELRSRVAPFTTWPRFVQRQNRDFRFGATVTSAQANTLSAQIVGGSLTPTTSIDLLAHGVFDDTYAPAARLYSAYFLRRPDMAGLDYWVGRLRGGVGLAYVSQFFSASAEFRGLYGTLTNRQLVELIYENILGRPGEPSGVGFWTGELDSGRRSRGWVMIGFSESSEYRTAQQVAIDTMLIYRGMLQRMPTGGEYASVATRRAGGLTFRRFVLEVLGSDEYAPRAD